MTGERDGKSGLSGEMINMHDNPTNEQDADSIYSAAYLDGNEQQVVDRATI
jgi:hypothetical protein